MYNLEQVKDAVLKVLLDFTDISYVESGNITRMILEEIQNPTIEKSDYEKWSEGSEDEQILLLVEERIKNKE